MPQLHVSVSPEVAQAAHRDARRRGISVSSYLAEILARHLATGWPEGYFEDVAGAWQGEPLAREEPPEIEQRASLDREVVTR